MSLSNNNAAGFKSTQANTAFESVAFLVSLLVKLGVTTYPFLLFERILAKQRQRLKNRHNLLEKISVSSQNFLMEYTTLDILVSPRRSHGDDIMERNSSLTIY